MTDLERATEALLMGAELMKDAETEIRDLRAKLEKAIKALELMAEPMAHDCQTIARTILEEIK